MMALSEEGQDQERGFIGKKTLWHAFGKDHVNGTKTGTILSRKDDETQCSNSEPGYEVL